MADDTRIFHIDRTWTGVLAAENQFDVNTSRRSPPSTRNLFLYLSMYLNRLEIDVNGGPAPIPCNWSQIAKDIGACFSVNNNFAERNANIRLSECFFPAVTPSCPNWQALLEQLSRIRADMSVTFRDCAFAGDTVRQSITEALQQMNAVNLVFTNCTSVLPPSLGSEQMANRLNRTGLSCQKDDETDDGCPFHVVIENDAHVCSDRRDLHFKWRMYNAQPTSDQWQMIAAITGSSIATELVPMKFHFGWVNFRHSAGLETFLETMSGMSVDSTTTTIRRHVEVSLYVCKFLDIEALHNIGTAFASNKAVKSVILHLDDPPLCDMVDLLSQSATLNDIEFQIPRSSKQQNFICKSLAASTGLVSVKLEQRRDNIDYTEFVRDVRSSVTAAAFKTRSKYRDWFILPSEALPYLCDYVQFSMPRLIVSARECYCGKELYEEDEKSDDLYRLTVLYDMFKSRNTLLQHVRNNSLEGKLNRSRSAVNMKRRHSRIRQQAAEFGHLITNSFCWS